LNFLTFRATILQDAVTWAIEMTNTSPQDPASNQTYKYDYTRFAKISDRLKYPMVSSVFLADSSLLKEAWVNDVASLLLRIRSNQAMYDVAINQKRSSTLQLIFDLRLLYILSDPQQSAWIRTIYNVVIRRLLAKPPVQSGPVNVDPSLDEYLIKQQVKVIQNKQITVPTHSSKLSNHIFADYCRSCGRR
jgi:hypothetical protein